MTAALVEAPPLELDVRLRDAVEDDRSYILAKWRESWKLARANRRMSRGAYNAHFDDLVDRGILAQPDTRVLIACDVAQPDAILGWLCFTPGVPTVHYAYVRRPCRGAGLLGLMLTVGVGVKEGGAFAYTFRPRERSHPQGKDLGLEDGLVEAAHRRRMVVRFVPPGEFLGRARRS